MTVAIPAEGTSGRLRTHLAIPMYRNAYALLVNTGITSVLGLAYWALAAHFYPPAEVGRAASAISAMLLLSGIAQCNLSNALPRLVPAAGAGTRRLVLRSYGLAAAVSVVLGGTFAALAASLGWAGGFLGEGWGFAVWFVVAVVAWSIFFLEDSVLAGLRQAMWVPVENTAFSIGKIVLLVALAGVSIRFGLFGSFTIPVAIAVIPVNGLIFFKLLPRHRQAASPVRVRVRSYLAGEYAGGLCNLATTTVMPLLVASQAGSVANAYFYSAWVVGSSFEYVLSSIATSLVVEGANDRLRARWAVRRGAVMAGAVLVPAVVVTVVAAPIVLSVMGTSYSSRGTVVLRLIALAVVPRGVVALSMALARIRQDVDRMLMIQGASCILTLGLALVLLPPLGLKGAGLAYLIAQSTVAAVLLPRLVRMLGGKGWGGRTPEVAVAGTAPEPGRPNWVPAAMKGPGVSFRRASLYLAVAVGGLTGLHAHLFIQPLLAVAFFVWVPGAAVISLLDIRDRLTAAVSSVALSIAIGALTAEGMLWVGAWHPEAAIVVLATASAAILFAGAGKP